MELDLSGWASSEICFPYFVKPNAALDVGSKPRAFKSNKSFPIDPNGAAPASGRSTEYKLDIGIRIADF
jgi:hypothetical protein